MSGRPRVVIIGAGFGGLWAAKALAEQPVEVLLLDRNNYHTFQPLLYQVGAAELEAEEIAYPVRTILRGWDNARFAMGEVAGVDVARRRILFDGREVEYDYLIVSAGAVTHYFGVPGAAEHAFPLKTLDEAVILRNHILSRFERAAYESDRERRRRMLTFAVVGGGPTGVEFAGALSELIRGPLARDYGSSRVGDARVVLIEAADRMLPALPVELGDYARRRLNSMGVEIRVPAVVERVGPEGVALRDAETIPTETTVWTAGVQGVPAIREWGLPVGRGGRVPVLPTLQCPGHPEVYVVGDLGYVEQDGGALPGVAPVAMQEGRWAAHNIARQVAGLTPDPFRYLDKGTMATIGRNAAVARLLGRTFTGFLAWIIWLAVHIYYLIGFRNRLFVLTNWAWDYFFFERTVRLILPGGERSSFSRTHADDTHSRGPVPRSDPSQALEPGRQERGT